MDPITPLLIPWTYQSMLYEFFHMKDDRLQLDDLDDAHNDSKISSNIQSSNLQIALSFQASQDPFFAGNRLKYYGDVGLAIKSYIQEFFDMRGRHLKIDSLSEMKRFTEQHGQFSEREANVQKHVRLLELLHGIVDKYSLYELSEFEQGLASLNNLTTSNSALGINPFSSLGQEGFDPEFETISSQLKMLSSKKTISDELQLKLALLCSLKMGSKQSQRFNAELKTIFSSLSKEKLEVFFYFFIII